MSDLPSSRTRATGLTEAEVRDRQRIEGYNELPRPNRRTPFRILTEVLDDDPVPLPEPGIATPFDDGVADMGWIGRVDARRRFVRSAADAYS